MAFLEVSSAHPAYSAGNTTVAGACVTILKAWFDESYQLKNSVIPNDDGTALLDYNAPDKDKLTVGGELNKLPANMAIARNGAGVYWRRDYTESVKLGEAITLGILQEQSLTYNEDIKGIASFTLTTFDGKKIKIENGQVKPG
jgi:hypothetical protein